jgi:predicted DsbA family dithiol-disulfide isomerase
MRVDVWSDVVCPWCYIGFVRLDKALQQWEGDVEVYHHAFELDPNADGEPVLAAEYLAEKYGVAVEDALGMMEEVSKVAASEGLNYQLGQTMHGNTRMAHRLLAFAATKGVQHELLIRLFNAYFEHAHKVFTVDDLMPFAVAAGLDAEEVKAVLASDEYEEVVAYDRELSEQIGVRGVPFFVFNQRVAVAGAESVELMLQAMTRAKELEAADVSGAQ